MNEAPSATGIASAKLPPAPPLPSGFKRWQGPLMLLLLWIAAWAESAKVWKVDEAYQHGWSVPFLTAYLIWCRFQSSTTPLFSAPAPSRRCLLPGFLAIALSYPPVWILRAANPDWRAIGIALALLALAATWLWLWQVGGKSAWSAFAWATAFAAVAVPWPTGLESWAAQVLMPLNASFALEGLHWLGVDAVRHGNVITLAAGRLGVDEACSGLRSLQGTLMLALFLGEWNGLSAPRRCLLLAGGIVLALVSNALRTITLALLAGMGGMAAVDRAHDPAGWIALGINAGVLLLAARPPQRTPTPLQNPRHGAVLPQASAQPPPSSYSFGPAICMVGLLLALPLETLWYKLRSVPTVVAVTRPVPPPSSGFVPLPIAPRAVRILHFTHGWHIKWQPEGLVRAEAFYLHWNPGVAPPGLFNMHRPENCLSAAGFEWVAELPPVEVTHQGVLHQFRCLQFRDDRTLVHVLQSDTGRTLIPNAAATSWHALELSVRSRSLAAWRGWRSPARSVLEIGLWGNATRATLVQEILRCLDQS